ncbi:MAG: general substrate transporter [Monoraphidium minutum]|nr:MAG: general substrate transporter [Monoraphidium minutum]
MAPAAMASGPSFDAERIAMYDSKITPAVILIAIVAASGGLLFGFDNGITGGVIAHPDFGPKFFPHMAHTAGTGDVFCKYDDHMLQLFTSSLFIAAAFSAMVGSWTCNKWGRKMTMLIGGACFLVGTGLVAGAVALPMLVIGRIILGFGVGFACQATPLYLSEMAPHKARGSLNIMFQLAVTIGILGAQLINYGTQYLRDYGWRVSLACGAVPALMLTLGALILPDTPNSLVLRGKKEEGRKVLQRIRGTDHVDVEFEDICEAVTVASRVKNPYRTIVQRRYWPQLAITIAIPMFQQLTGINAIMFYAPQLFEATGAGTEAALLASVVTGAVNVVSTIVAIVVVDRLGRKFLFLAGGTQMLLCEIAVGVLIHLNFLDPGNGAMASAIVALICIYVAGFAWSWGPLGWLVPSEIQPLETRAAGMGIATLTNFMFTFLIGQIFLSMLCGLKYGTFFLFAGFVVLMTLFVILCVPETKGVPIEELNEVVTQKVRALRGR